LTNKPDIDIIVIIIQEVIIKPSEEWFLQSDYDYSTAEYMFNGGRYFYAVFMCHLSIEKALKGLYTLRLNEIPPKIHSLIYFIEKLNLDIPLDHKLFLSVINDLGVVVRYPDTLKQISNEFTNVKTESILLKTKSILNSVLNDFEQEIISRGIKIYKIVLFGSALRGTYSNDSDIDIALISDDFKDKSISERAVIMSDIEFGLTRKYLVPLDIIKLTIDEYENETRMIASYVKEGKVMYSA
jgi:HEPN domain-containing protein